MEGEKDNNGIKVLPRAVYALDFSSILMEEKNNEQRYEGAI